MSPGGMRSPEILKCCSERWVCAPHNRSEGTSMGPKVSRSVLVFISPPCSRPRSSSSGELQEDRDLGLLLPGPVGALLDRGAAVPGQLGRGLGDVVEHLAHVPVH